MCRNEVTEKNPVDIECPMCGAFGCNHCDNGFFPLSECPSQYIGPELVSDLQIITASEHHLPVAGGLLDQSAWWFDLRQALKQDEAKIQSDQQRRYS